MGITAEICDWRNGVQCSIYAAKIPNGFAAVNFGAVLREELQNHASAQRFDKAPKLDSRLDAMSRA
jgi:hypothetical protein